MHIADHHGHFGEAGFEQHDGPRESHARGKRRQTPAPHVGGGTDPMAAQAPRGEPEGQAAELEEEDSGEPEGRQPGQEVGGAERGRQLAEVVRRVLRDGRQAQG